MRQTPDIALLLKAHPLVHAGLLDTARASFNQRIPSIAVPHAQSNSTHMPSYRPPQAITRPPSSSIVIQTFPCHTHLRAACTPTCGMQTADATKLAPNRHQQNLIISQGGDMGNTTTHLMSAAATPAPPAPAATAAPQPGRRPVSAGPPTWHQTPTPTYSKDKDVKQAPQKVVGLAHLLYRRAMCYYYPIMSGIQHNWLQALPATAGCGYVSQGVPALPTGDSQSWWIGLASPLVYLGFD